MQTRMIIGTGATMSKASTPASSRFKHEFMCVGVSVCESIQWQQKKDSACRIFQGIHVCASHQERIIYCLLASKSAIVVSSRPHAPYTGSVAISQHLVDFHHKQENLLALTITSILLHGTADHRTAMK